MLITAASPTSPRSHPPLRRGLLEPAAIVAGVLLAALLAATYGPRLATRFASEDYLILGYLARQGPLREALRELTSSWLALDFVGFYRPVSTLLLAAELTLWGPVPGRFHATHLALHALNALLVGCILRSLLRETPAWLSWAGALLFALHPLHPSAVLFTGAFATLFGATFTLLSLLLFLTAPRPSALVYTASLASFALALGSYEAAAVLPVVLLVSVVGSGERSAVRRTLPFFLLLALYLGTRVLVLGSPVAGYSSFRERLGDPLFLFSGIVPALGRILDPVWGQRGPLEVLRLGLAGALVAGGLTAALLGRRVAAVRFALVGISWSVLFLAPFTFVGLVPANGRYAYLAVAGVVLALVACTGAWQARSSAGMVLSLLVVSLLAAHWIVPLVRYLRAYGEADRVIRTLRQDLVQLAEATGEAEPGVTLLVTGQPDFIEGPTGVPVAKVFQYGLVESLRPPFADVATPVLALPRSVEAAARARLGALGRTRLYEWRSDSESWEPAAAGGPHAVGHVAVVSGFDGIRARCRPCFESFLFVLTPGLLLQSRPTQDSGQALRFDVPVSFLTGAARHYRGPSFWWIETRRQGTATALSAIHRFRLRGDVVADFVGAAGKMRRGPGPRAPHGPASRLPSRRVRESLDP